ncbi:MAG: chemotaxis protein CheV [Lachnospiraceae bacterium]|nr:chemotaxis protein CheV [Lachnospiraceae bacterium]
MDTNILLENGTNELEVLEFMIGDNHYGINVAKVREIIPYEAPTYMPNVHPSIEGIFIPRDIMITVVDLAHELKITEPSKEERDMLVISHFNKLDVAFHVHKIVGIHRLSWEKIMIPDATIHNAESSVATGVIKFDDRIVIILDFEKIITDICPETGLKVSEVDKLGVRMRDDSPILIAEDSALLSKLIYDSLVKAGYSNVTLCNNGKVAWDKLVEYKEAGTIDKNVKCIITDIEMPLMDGHRLTKLVKTDDKLKNIPLVIFSSLISTEMFEKGKALGADAQMSKPEIGNLVQIIDSLLDGKK